MQVQRISQDDVLAQECSVPSSAIPIVSVIIPCFRAGKFLKEAVSSALNQEGAFDLREVIVVDDGSDDEVTLEIYREIASWPKVQVLSNVGVKGSAGARNTGIRKAAGDWIAFLDADDWWLPDSLRVRFAALLNFPGADWIGGDFVEQERSGELLTSGRFARNLENYSFLRPAYENDTKSICLKAPLREFLTQAPTHTIVSIVKRSLLEKVGLFEENLLRQQDIHLFLRLANQSAFVFVPRIVACYRLHEANSTRSLTHTQEWRIVALLNLLDRPEFRTERKLLRTQIAELHLSNSYEYRREQDFISARRSALQGGCISPGNIRLWKSFVASLLKLA